MVRLLLQMVKCSERFLLGFVVCMYCYSSCSLTPLTHAHTQPSPSPESSGPRPVSPALGKKIMSKLDSISVIERERDKLERRLTEVGRGRGG